MAARPFSLSRQTGFGKVQVPSLRGSQCSTSRGASLVAFNRKGNKKTQVVLTTTVPKLGVSGDLVTVQQGFMYNYLLPQGLAKPATTEILADIKAKIAAEQAAKDDIKQKARAMATALQTLGVIRIAKKAGDKDQIFGSVQPQEITSYVEAQTGRQLNPSDVELPEIKSLGTYEGTIKLHPEVTGFFKVQVTKQAQS